MGEEALYDLHGETIECIEITCGNDPMHYQVKVYRNADGSYHLSCSDCDWWATGLRGEEPAREEGTTAGEGTRS